MVDEGLRCQYEDWIYCTIYFYVMLRCVFTKYGTGHLTIPLLQGEGRTIPTFERGVKEKIPEELFVMLGTYYG